jgi:PERQ amino acid-rich with GYF domain-containing protein
MNQHYPSQYYCDPSKTRTYLSFLVRGRRPNGATQTFRRNTNLSTSSHGRDATAGQTPTSANPGVYVPPHLHSSRTESGIELRLSKEQLVDIFKSQRGSDHFGDSVSNLFAEGWAPSILNGSSSTAWGRREDSGKDHQPGADVCWDRDGSLQPLALMEMSVEEKEVGSELRRKQATN